VPVGDVVFLLLAVGHERDGVVDPAGREACGERGVEGSDDVSLAEVDVAWMVDLVGEGVFLGVKAPVLRLAVRALALQLAVDGQPGSGKPDGEERVERADLERRVDRLSER
jgi:hypothetical protein